jgi:hypothetical protein
LLVVDAMLFKIASGSVPGIIVMAIASVSAAEPAVDDLLVVAEEIVVARGTDGRLLVEISRLRLDTLADVEVVGTDVGTDVAVVLCRVVKLGLADIEDAITHVVVLCNIVDPKTIAANPADLDVADFADTTMDAVNPSNTVEIMTREADVDVETSKETEEESSTREEAVKTAPGKLSEAEGEALIQLVHVDDVTVT